METRMKKILAGLAAGAALAVLGACLLPAGDGVCLNTDGNDTCGTVTAPPDTNLTLVFQKVLNNPSQPTCNCHNGTSTPHSSNPLNFSTLITARNTLFMEDGSPRGTYGAPTTAPLVRVSKDSVPANSYLYQKISSVTPKNGTKMPPGNTQLTSEQIELIRRWIQLGAPL
jgi:hypothetical protein